MNSGLFRQDAAQVICMAEHLRRYWHGVELTREDKRVALTFLRQAQNRIDSLIRRYGADLQMETMKVEARDLGEGDEVWFHKQEARCTVISADDDPIDPPTLKIKFKDEQGSEFSLFALPEEIFEVVA